jgi:hypothetical protein
MNNSVSFVGNCCKREYTALNLRALKCKPNRKIECSQDKLILNAGMSQPTTPYVYSRLIFS